MTIVLCDDAFIAALNSQWRGIPSPTDVLSFPQVSPGEIASFLTGKTAAPPLLGDIVISLETVERRAQKTDFQEIERLFIHGLAHLLGHDHIEDHEAAAMEALEKDLARRIGPETLSYLENSL